jgi:hypothetical protein
MTQAQTPQFGEARVAPIHLSVASVVSTDVFSSMASVVIANSVWHAQEPIVDKDWIEFSMVAAEWKRETRYLSQLRKVFASEHYAKIIALGPDKAVPLIIRQLLIEGDAPYHWFAALVTLTNENPAAEVGGKVRDISRSWIDWGRARYGGQLAAE